MAKIVVIKLSEWIGNTTVKLGQDTGQWVKQPEGLVAPSGEC